MSATITPLIVRGQIADPYAWTWLAADPSTTHLGLALVRPRPRKVFWCTVLKGPAVARWDDWMWEERVYWLARKLRENPLPRGVPFQAVAYEWPYSGPNPEVGLMLGHVCGFLVQIAEANGVPAIRVPTATVKKALSGRGDADKEAMIAAATPVIRRWLLRLGDDAEHVADCVGVAAAAPELFLGRDAEQHAPLKPKRTQKQAAAKPSTKKPAARTAPSRQLAKARPATKDAGASKARASTAGRAAARSRRSGLAGDVGDKERQTRRAGAAGRRAGCACGRSGRAIQVPYSPSAAWSRLIWPTATE